MKQCTTTTTTQRNGTAFLAALRSQILSRQRTPAEATLDVAIRVAWSETTHNTNEKYIPGSVYRNFPSYLTLTAVLKLSMEDLSFTIT